MLPRTQLLVLSEEDLPGGEAAAVAWLQQVPLGAITRGRRGATLYVNGDPYHVEADAATEADETGAGDEGPAAVLDRAGLDARLATYLKRGGG